MGSISRLGARPAMAAQKSGSHMVQQNQAHRAKQTQPAQKYVKAKLARNRQAIKAKAKQNRQIISQRMKTLTEKHANPAFTAAGVAGIDISV